jgi:hypothetical protein
MAIMEWNTCFFSLGAMGIIAVGLRLGKDGEYMQQMLWNVFWQGLTLSEFLRSLELQRLPERPA